MLLVTKQLHDDDVYDTVHFIHKVLYLQDLQTSKNDVVAVTSTPKKGKIIPEQLAKRLNVPREMAKKTLLVITQQGVRSSNEPTLTRNIKQMLE